MTILIAFMAGLWLVLCRWAADALAGLPPAELWPLEQAEAGVGPVSR